MKRVRTRFLAILLYIVVTSLISCHAYKISTSPISTENEAEESPRILFLDYQVSRDTLDTKFMAQLINMLTVKGKIKEGHAAPDQPGLGDLELVVQDSQQQIMTQLYIPNPLDRSVEYVNSTGQLERKMVHLDSAQFSIRLQIEPGASFIVLKRMIDENEGTLLLQTPIL
jgi:hypothetical protein